MWRHVSPAERLAQKATDARGRRVVFLSHCLLDENTRYLGGAGRPGCVREIVDLYESPNLTVEQVRASLDSDDFDPLKAFSSACRAELLTIAPTFTI